MRYITDANDREDAKRRAAFRGQTGSATDTIAPARSVTLWSSAPTSKALPPYARPLDPPPLSSQCWRQQTPAGLGGCIWMPPVNGTGNSPVSGTSDPRSSQTGQVIRGLH